jgi:hypothetical protein
MCMCVRPVRYYLQTAVGCLKAESKSEVRPWRTAFLQNKGLAVAMQFFLVARGRAGAGGPATPSAAAAAGAGAGAGSAEAEDPSFVQLQKLTTASALNVLCLCANLVMTC